MRTINLLCVLCVLCGGLLLAGCGNVYLKGDALTAALREKWPSTRIESLSSPLALNARDQNILAPLIGQMLR